MELKSTDKTRVPELLIINQQPLLKNVAIYRLIVNNNPGNSPVFIVTYFHHADRGKTICNQLVLHTPTFTPVFCAEFHHRPERFDATISKFYEERS